MSRRNPKEAVITMRDVAKESGLSTTTVSIVLNNANYEGENFDQVRGPSYREIFDVGYWDNSVTVNVPGESGQPGSPQYFGLRPLWEQIRYLPMLHSRASVEKEARHRMVLEPN